MDGGFCFDDCKEKFSDVCGAFDDSYAGLEEVDVLQNSIYFSRLLAFLKTLSAERRAIPILASLSIDFNFRKRFSPLVSVIT